MSLPADVRPAVHAALAERGAARIAKISPVGGGCISDTARIEDESGASYFLKWGEQTGAPGLFIEEARSLRALAQTGAVRVPAVLAATGSFLMLEWLAPGRPGAGAWKRAGRAIAELHRTQADAYGWEHDNWIGSLPQSNTRRYDWSTFWREARIVPQLERAYAAGHFARADRVLLERHLEALPVLLAAGQEEGPSLLHGDLWGGNVHAMADGELAFIDPSSWFGHREVDLAMAHLFGGFDGAFFDAYEDAWPLPRGSAQRRAAYQVYYLLVHVNLFGSGYCQGVMRAVARAESGSF